MILLMVVVLATISLGNCFVEMDEEENRNLEESFAILEKLGEGSEMDEIRELLAADYDRLLGRKFFIR